MMNSYTARLNLIVQVVLNVGLGLWLGVARTDTMVALMGVVALAILTLGWQHGRIPQLVFISFMGAGYLGEIWAVARGVWQYQFADFLGIPFYIGVAWGIVGVSAWVLGRACEEWLAMKE